MSQTYRDRLVLTRAEGRDDGKWLLEGYRFPFRIVKNMLELDRGDVSTVFYCEGTKSTKSYTLNRSWLMLCYMIFLQFKKREGKKNRAQAFQLDRLILNKASVFTSILWSWCEMKSIHSKNAYLALSGVRWLVRKERCRLCSHHLGMCFAVCGRSSIHWLHQIAICLLHITKRAGAKFQDVAIFRIPLFCLNVWRLFSWSYNGCCTSREERRIPAFLAGRRKSLAGGMRYTVSHTFLTLSWWLLHLLHQPE